MYHYRQLVVTDAEKFVFWPVVGLLLHFFYVLEEDDTADGLEEPPETVWVIVEQAHDLHNAQDNRFDALGR